jgi:hypothetical protein
MKLRVSGRRVVPGCALALALAGCEQSATTGAPPAPVVVTLSPEAVTLAGVGATMRLAATVTGGAEGVPRTVTWRTSNGAVAVVDDSGSITATAGGSATITATAVADTLARASAGVTVHVDPTDATPPSIQFAGENAVAESASFATAPALAQYLIGFADAGSGFTTVTPVRVIEQADTGGGLVCVDGGSPDCATPALHDGGVNVDGPTGLQQGYIRMSAWVVDRSGNRSPTLTRRVLVDYTQPRADSATVATGPLAGGTAVTFRTWLQDNVALASATGQLEYEAVFIKNLNPATLGSFGQLRKSAPGDLVDPFFIRAFRFLDFSGWFRPFRLFVTVNDVAGNRFAYDLAVPGLPTPTPTVDPYARVINATATVAPDSVNLRATLTFTSELITAPPNSQVQFYGTSARIQSLVATATSPSIVVDPTIHRATFSWTAVASSKVNPRGLVAMYVTPDGIALCLLP